MLQWLGVMTPSTARCVVGCRLYSQTTVSPGGASSAANRGSTSRPDADPRERVRGRVRRQVQVFTSAVPRGWGSRARRRSLSYRTVSRTTAWTRYIVDMWQNRVQQFTESTLLNLWGRRSSGASSISPALASAPAASWSRTRSTPGTAFQADGPASPNGAAGAQEAVRSATGIPSIAAQCRYGQPHQVLRPVPTSAVRQMGY